MTIEEIQARFYKAEVAQIAPLLSGKGDVRTLKLDGLTGSSYALLASKLADSAPSTQLFVLSDREKAAFFYNDLEKLLHDQKVPLPNKRVHYLPASYKRAHSTDEIDNSNVKLRSEIVNKLANHPDTPYCIVSYPEAVAEKVLTQQFISQHSFTIRCGEEISADTFLDYLYQFEYLQEDFVFEPGQFAWRGSIFDIFSFSEEYPYRIELDGDRIESIRFFDPESQLSIRDEESIHIMPKIVSHQIEEKRIPLLEFLPADTVLWLEHPRDIGSQIAALYRKVDEEYQSTPASDSTLQVDDLFIRRRDFDKEAAQRTRCLIETGDVANPDLILDFNIKPQNHFGRSFDYLLLEWIDNFEKGIHSLFLSENQSQLERMEKVMVDLVGKYNRHNEASLTLEQLYTPVRGILHEGFRDEQRKWALYTDHQFFEKNERVVIRDRYKKSEAFTLKEIYDLQPGDYVVHIDHGVGIYQGLVKTEMNGATQEAIRLMYKDGAILDMSIHSLYKISKYVGKEGTPPTLHSIGSGSWDKLKERTKKRVKELAIDLIKLYSQRKARKGFAFSPDNFMQAELEASFIYEDTPDQVKTLADVKADMESEHPMDRLICGDVGFGKTEIAIRAAFKAVCDNKQVAVLVPTTVLALQHYTTFTDRLAEMPCTVEYVNRFKTSKQIREILKRLKDGRIDILIGTHRLLSKDVVFKDLGLLIIDEEQKFGVAAKEKLRELRVSVDTLTMSATPIPRTLQFSLMGARDISVITTPPPNRQPIQTEVHVFDEDILRQAVQFELNRGGQVFVVHNKIQNIAELAGLIQRLVPQARIAVGHGQMEGAELERIMTDFIDHQTDVLVSTTIVESGLDIVNANTMVINDAQNFALNVLHQLRGRVGRNNQKAFCYLFTKPFEVLNDQARRRLQAIEDFSDIGSGLQIALRDLDIRGAGNILGADQSGFINEIGYEMYQKILSEAIQEMQYADYDEVEMADNSAILTRECILETDIEALFPTDYVSNVSERMSLYKELQAIRDLIQLDKFRKKVTDIFGPMPAQTVELMQTIPLRLTAARLHFEKILLKKQTLTGYFSGSAASRYFQSDEFGRVLAFLQANHPAIQLKEVNHKLLLIIHHIPTIKAALHWMQKMEAFCTNNP
ncbi:MAG: transcription-repair coupling factor [Bacteroidales bacterium]|nr:transcription-repair coupling factor [Bacteroidales bacterium]